MTCGWRHNHPPPRVAKPTSPTAWTGRHRRVADSPIPPPTFHDQSRIPTAAGGARGQRCTTHSHTATHHHHTSPPPTPSALGGNHNMQQAADWGTRPRRPLLAPPSQQQQSTSARHVPSSRHRLTGSQARGRLRIRARAILDCMCCDVPQSTPHTTAGNACRWARRCRLVMESLTHKTADPSPSTRTTTACAPPASRIFVDIDSIGFPLSAGASRAVGILHPEYLLALQLSTRWWAIDRRWAGSRRQHTITGNQLARHGFYQQRGSLPTTLRDHTTMTETRRHRQP